jgi:PhoH-like ATPase
VSELRLPVMQTEPVPKTYVLDTNVLIYDPNAIHVFDEHDVVIPITVIEEIDRFKHELNERGRNARTISRMLDELRRQGSLREGVELNERGGTLRVDFMSHRTDLPITWGPDSNDNRILAAALGMNTERPAGVILVTRDTNMRLKCDALGVYAEDYENAHIDVDEVYSGVLECECSRETIDAIYQAGSVKIDEVEIVPNLYPNQFILFTAHDATNKTVLVRVDSKRGLLKLVGRHKEGVWGIFARNKEQLFAMDLLLDDSVKVVTLNGVAGTGKTLMALACGLRLVADESRYRRLVVSRPIFPLGRDVGYLPGDLEQKMTPWMQPIFDNLEFLLSTRNDFTSGGGQSRGMQEREPEYQYLMDQKIIQVEALTYIRGRSIPKQYLIVDEAQNLTPHEIKTVLTRAGEGTKVVITGDPYQIDNPYVDAMSNGLTYTVERFKGSPLAGHVTLRKGERSELAELAAKLL